MPAMIFINMRDTLRPTQNTSSTDIILEYTLRKVTIDILKLGFRFLTLMTFNIITISSIILTNNLSSIV